MYKLTMTKDGVTKEKYYSSFNYSLGLIARRDWERTGWVCTYINTRTGKNAGKLDC